VEWLLFLGILFFLISTGVWLGIAMAATGLILLHFSGGGAESLAALSVWNYLNTYTLSALPIFLFMGEILVVAGLSEKIYSSLAPLFARLPGKLLHTNIFVCALFSAICGSSMATAAAVGSFVYPELDRRNYDRKVVAGSLAGAGTLGILIPPSMALIIYGAWQDVSVGQLFIAGIIPGIMMAILFMLYIGIFSKIRPNIVPQTREVIIPLWQAIKQTVSIWPIVILIFVIIGTIYLGLATPTESAGLGAVTAIILGILFGKMNFRRRRKCSCPICSTNRHAPAIGNACPGEWVVTYIHSGCNIFIIYVIRLLFMVIEIGQLTPPLGVNLYVLQGITEGQLSVEEVAVGAIPYWSLLLLGLIIITIFPQICLWLPNYAF
jgi:TRAP-type C4-dicarboxylate transport system permease large subunit